MNKTKTILFSAFAFVILGCTPQAKISYNYDKSANFGQFKTFTIVKPAAGDMNFFEQQYPKIVNEQNIARVEESIIKEMESRGYVQSAGADLMVSYFIQLQTNTTIQSSTISNGTTPGYYGYYDNWGGIGGVNITTQDYRTGDLVINVVNSKTNNLVWFGSASGLMSANPSKSYQNIPIRIGQIFSDYFWKAGQSEPVTPIPSK